MALGIAVDDTMHPVRRYRHEFLRFGNYAEALRAALRDSGRALFITSVVLVLGLLVSILSSLASQVNFGVLLATMAALSRASFAMERSLASFLSMAGP